MRETPEDIRATLMSLADRHKVTLTALSRMIGRSPSYLGRFVESGSPAHLLPKDRLLLAQYFRIDERLLGAEEDEARAPWSPPREPTRKRWLPWWKPARCK